MATRIPTMYGRYYVISFIWRGRQMTFTAYRSNLSKMQRPQAQKICDKMYPGCRVISFHESDPTDGPVVLTTESKGKCGKGEYFCNDEQKCKPIPEGHHVMPDGMLMKGKKHSVKEALDSKDKPKLKKVVSMLKKASKAHASQSKALQQAMEEEAPKGAKYDRMIKHIKKSYSKDGNLTKGEEGIAYATAWKHKNKNKKEEYDKSKNCGCGKDPCITYGKQIDPDCQVDEGKKLKKKEKSVQHATDVPNFPQDQVSEGAAWQRKEGKNKSGGLNEKGRKSYERENPGSDLKAPSKKKGNKRRASFCARMKGMKKKLTSAKTARDPDSRINKSLRAWNC